MQEFITKNIRNNNSAIIVLSFLQISHICFRTDYVVSQSVLNVINQDYIATSDYNYGDSNYYNN